MIKRLLSKGWYFSNNMKDYTPVDLPHDYQISSKRTPTAPSGSSNGYYPDKKGVYVKYLDLSEDKHYVLDLDGAYMCTDIWLNENHVASHPYGYTPFLAELTPYVIEGMKNKLFISTSPLEKSSRWYNGNGLFRDVFLWEGGAVRVMPRDLFVYTKSIKGENATVVSEITVTSDIATRVTLKGTITSPDGRAAADFEKEIEVKADSKSSLSLSSEIEHAMLWDTESPNLYNIRLEVISSGKICDECELTFGIRTVKATAKDGLLINGKPLKLRGGCIHHDHGVLGSAAFPAAEERKLGLIKGMGFNAIRCAHNPPSLALLEYCDRTGIIVMDEAFDMWNKAKSQNDYHLFFDEWCLRDISYMVLRDRNHPSVISYSIGNEIHEIDGSGRAAENSRMLAEEVRRYDKTRLVTSGLQKDFIALPKPDPYAPEDYKKYLEERFHISDKTREVNAITDGYESPLDIVGCNYYYERYPIDHECNEKRVLWGSENVALSFYDSWKATLDNSYVIGDFTWTAYDNMGEVGAGQFKWARDGVQIGITLGAYPWRCCYQGDFDLCGHRRPQSYFREAVWGFDKEPHIFVTHPEHYGEGFSGTNWHWYDVNECWTYGESYVGRPVKVETYTSADEILWLVNGREVGRTKPVKAIATLDTVYEPGEITAVAYKRGEEISRYTLETTGAVSRISLRANKDVMLADRRDLCYIDIDLTDVGGRTVTDAENELTCSVTGGELMGIYSANPACEDQYTSPKCHAFKGRALAVIRTDKPGTVSVTVHSQALAGASVTVTAK